MKNTRIYLIAILFAVAFVPVNGQIIERVDPPSWFTGMKESALQLMVYGKGIAAYDVKADYPGVRVTTLVKTENPNYLFVNLDISRETVPGNINLIFTSGKKNYTHEYPLFGRPSGKARGINCSDVLYLLMPDRFANGDPANDIVEGMTEQPDRSKPGGRHGGDLKGIINSLDYLKN